MPSLYLPAVLMNPHKIGIYLLFSENSFTEVYFIKFTHCKMYNSMTHHPNPPHFHHPTKIPCAHLQLIPITSQVLSNHRSAFYFYQFAFSRHCIEMDSHNICEIFCHWLLSLNIIFLRFIQVVININNSFLFMSE